MVRFTKSLVVALIKPTWVAQLKNKEKNAVEHRQHYGAYLNRCGAKHERSYMLFDEFGIVICRILLIKDLPCNSRTE